MYCDDIYVGYRHYDSIDLPVQFPFGHGLSYTTFIMTELRVEVEEQELIIQLKLTNAGPVYGSEVVQVYISQRSPSVPRPSKELKAFSKHRLQAGVSTNVRMSTPVKYATSFWDESVNAWTSEAGTYDVFVGNSSQSPKFLHATCDIAATTSWNGV